MPRRRKTGQSPARVPDRPPEGRKNVVVYPVPLGPNRAMENNFAPSGSLSSSTKEQIAESMQEMFSHLDPEVIDIVLSECDFKVEIAMDSLLQLSEAAEDAAPLPSPMSGFERTAADLLGPPEFPDPRPNQDSFKSLKHPLFSPSSTSPLTEEMDMAVEQELETLEAKADIKGEDHRSQYLSISEPISLPPSAFIQQTDAEPPTSSPKSGSTGPLSQYSFSEAALVESSLPAMQHTTTEKHQTLVDFTHLVTEEPAEKPKPPLDLAALGRPSAFQAYIKQDPQPGMPGRTEVGPSDTVVAGARSKANTNLEPVGNVSWNVEAPVFSPCTTGNHEPTFITPVAQTSHNWPHHARQACPWQLQCQAPLKPSATIPKSWALPPASQYCTPNSYLQLEGNVLVLLRGAPGSGKSTLARTLLEQNPGGIILSTDNYFIHNGEYHYDPTVLGEAHEWNHKKAKKAFHRGISPIIIDNTNMQGWEMKPYVAQALKHGYKVLFKEPQTWWRNKPKELERRSTHGVHVEKIRRMLNGYERSVTVQSIMGSCVPEHKQYHILENTSSQLTSSEVPCPDLVGKPRLIEGTNVSRSHLFSSLPDVSSISQSHELDDGSYRSTESVHFQPTEQSAENADVSAMDDLNLEHLDSELDARLQLNNLVGAQQIPDCIVESVMNEESPENELPVAFSESIAQRVKRESRMKRFDPEKMEAADLVKDTNQSESEETEKKEASDLEFVWVMEEAKMLEFVGDWPTEGSLNQRQTRRGRHKERNFTEDKSVSQEVNTSEPDKTECPEELDLDQTNSSLISSRNEENLPKEVSGEDGGRIDGSYGNEDIGRDMDEQDGRDIYSMGELPDCVLDWKAADYCRARKSKFKIGAEDTDRNNGNVRDTVSSDFAPSVTAESLFVSSNAELNRHHDAESHNSEGVVDRKVDDVPTDPCTMDCRETVAEADSSLLSEASQSPVSEGSAEGQRGSLSANSQDKKLRQGRRSGKQCKLALTFTQNYPDAQTNTNESPRTPSDNTESHPNSPDTDDQHIRNVCSNSNLDPKPDLSTESKSETEVQSSSSSFPPPPPLQAESGCFIQTEPQDFALLWRLNRQDLRNNNTSTAASSNSGGFTVLCGDSSRFVPALSSVAFAAVAVNPLGHSDVLYRVVHEKGTQVEERDLGGTHDRLESLCILCRHFKLVNYDTLEDLYDKCHQDLEWTTNLLLDSGERFFKEEDDTEVEKQELESGVLQDKHDQNTPSPCRAPGGAETSYHPEVSCLETTGSEQVTELSSDATRDKSKLDCVDLTCVEGAAASFKSENTTRSSLWPGDLQIKMTEGETTGHREIAEPCSEAGASGGNVVINEDSVAKDDAASMDEIHRLSRAELEELNEQEERTERRQVEERRSMHLDIQSVELKLPTELAIQLIELFGPVGLDPGTCDTEDYKVNMDLHLAKLLHQKWKETIQETQRQTALLFHLFGESDDGYMTPGSQPEARGRLPFMDHWNASRPHVSLTDIIKEELALQKNVEKTRQSRVDLDQRNGATLLKEDKLFSLFPNIDRHFLQDIFRDHNYSLAQTELFLRSLLDEEPAKNVVAPEAPQCDHHRAASKEREKKAPESITPDFQDVEYPEYDDFRAEANLQRRRQLESFAKAAEASQQGRKQVASFYAQQGHLHGQRMREANHRAAVQIFERVNSSLLPRNILDLHGLHVDEALHHLDQVLEDKASDCEKGLCRPELSVITGKGNHSQGGVARIRPAVIVYLTNKQYRFTEPKPGLLLVSLK